MDRLESSVLTIDAWAPHIAFPLATVEKAGSTCWCWGSYEEAELK